MLAPMTKNSFTLGITFHQVQLSDHEHLAILQQKNQKMEKWRGQAQKRATNNEKRRQLRIAPSLR